jgi:hypothetical protein
MEVQALSTPLSDQRHGEKKSETDERFDQLLQAMVTQPVPSEKLSSNDASRARSNSTARSA